MTLHVITDEDKCIGCGNCERLLPGFKSKYSGDFLITDGNNDFEDRCYNVAYVRVKCLQNAIHVERL